jgi:branched-chain amino acid transport system substrate-binding protein
MKSKTTILLLLMAGCAALWFWRGNQVHSTATVRIGCLTPLTGDGATYGAATKRGIDMAVAETNERSGIKVEVIYEDDQMTPSSAIAGLRKLISFHKVPAVIGAFGSSVTLAAAPIAEAEKTVLFSASSTADAIAEAGDFIFRNVPSNKAQGATAAQFALDKLNAKSAAILAMNNDYGKSLSDSFRAVYTNGGGSIVVEDIYNSGDKDFRAQLQKIKDKAPSLVFFPGHYSESAPILRQAKEMGMTSAFIGGDGSYSPELITAAGTAAEGSYYTLMAVDFTTEPAKSFSDRFKRRYGQEADVYAAYAYDGATMIFKLLAEGNRDAISIKNALYRTQAYQGITGETSFDNKGEIFKPFALHIVRNGKFEPVNP